MVVVGDNFIIVPNNKYIHPICRIDTYDTNSTLSRITITIFYKHISSPSEVIKSKLRFIKTDKNKDKIDSQIHKIFTFLNSEKQFTDSILIQYLQLIAPINGYNENREIPIHTYFKYMKPCKQMPHHELKDVVSKFNTILKFTKNIKVNKYAVLPINLDASLKIIICHDNVNMIINEYAISELSLTSLYYTNRKLFNLIASMLDVDKAIQKITTRAFKMIQGA